MNSGSLHCHLELEPRIFFVLSHFYDLEVKFNTCTDNTDNIKLENLIFVVHKRTAIFIGRNWFIYLLEIFFRVAFRAFGEMI